ncbi:restriction endonuclease subunit S [Vibrio rotiferianus]|uniref:restriction endonuclease subunit S n=1 Tax=Vibrio rotiferianus TaxID=190895 RepID=UPI003908CD0E
MSLDQTPINQLITDNIDTWTSTVKTKATTGRGSSKKLELYGVKKLRELILELAVRGKLVPQDPSDEPASLLLERIATEKAQLVKDKIIRKPKKLDVLTDSELFFAAPSGWSFARLGDLAVKLTDGSHNPARDFGSGYPMFSSQNVHFGTIDFSSPSRYVDEDNFLKEDSRTQIAPGDILLTIVGTIGRAAVVPIDAPKFVLQRSVAVIKTSLIPEFLVYYLASPSCISYFEANGKGTAQKGIYLGKLAEMPIVVPSLEEQHRIVAKVDELMALCDQLEQQTEASIEEHQVLVATLLDTLTNSADADELMQNWARISEHFDTLFTTEASIDQLKQTILQLAVMGKLAPQDPNDEPAAKLLERIAEEKAQLIKEKKIKKQKALPPITDNEKLFELPKGWEWERVGTFGVVGTGATPSRSNPKYWDSPDHNWVSSGETASLFVGQTKEKVSELAIKETNVSVYPVGTLIVAMYGQGKTRGQITELSEPAGTNQACAAISLIEPNTAHKDFVKLYFRKSYEELRSNAAGGAQPNLNVGKVQNTVIAVPPLEEQHRINVMVHSLLELCESLKCNLTKAQSTQLHLTDAIVEQCNPM